MSIFDFDVCVVGGCGHVGLPLAISFAHAGLRVAIDDINEESVVLVRSGRMPFREEGADELLGEALSAGRLAVANDPGLVSRAEHVIIVIGTPVDEHLNPTYYAMRRFFLDLMPRFRPGQCVILRSTVYPGTTGKLNEIARDGGCGIHLAYCPERIAEGHAIAELHSLPQIVSGCDPIALEMASSLFCHLTAEIVPLLPVEAELAKMFANSWRYIQFAAANQFFMIAENHGVDFYRIHEALTHRYPRMAGLPRSGFAAGPCLLKDTMQLAAATNNNFQLGHAAMLVNEGLPDFIVHRLKSRHHLGSLTVGILGMAFKAESDDPRESLSYKLRKILEYEAKRVLSSDEYILDPRFISAERLVAEADIIVVGAPHRRYRTLEIPPGKVLVDIWNVFGRGASVG